MHAMQMIDNRECSEMHATAGKEREVSSGHLVKTALLAGRTHGRARMVAISRRKRMVAHCIADVPFMFAVMARLRPFFEEDLLIMFLTLGLYVVPPDKVEVEPCFVVAALIGLA